MRKTSTVTMIIAAVLLCAAGITMAVVGNAWSGGPAKPGADPSASAMQPPAPAGLDLAERLHGVIPSTTIVTADMSIFWVNTYSMCSHMKVREESPDKSLVGLTLAQFAGHYPDFKMTLDSGVIRMERVLDQYCPDHYIIKSDGKGAIYVYRNMEGLATLTMVTKLNFAADAIPPDYRPLLQEGMAFGSIEEIEGLIEDAES